MQNCGKPHLSRTYLRFGSAKAVGNDHQLTIRQGRSIAVRDLGLALPWSPIAIRAFKESFLHPRLYSRTRYDLIDPASHNFEQLAQDVASLGVEIAHR